DPRLRHRRSRAPPFRRLLADDLPRQRPHPPHVAARHPRARRRTGNAMTNERLTSADKRLLLVCALVAAVSLFVGIRYYFEAFPEASIDFRVTRQTSLPVAEAFLARLHADSRGYRHAAIFDFDDEQKTFLERELGVEGSN